VPEFKNAILSIKHFSNTNPFFLADNQFRKLDVFCSMINNDWYIFLRIYK